MSLWSGKYVFLVVSFMTSLLGSSVVHYYYQPMADFEELVQLEMQERTATFKESETDAKKV